MGPTALEKGNERGKAERQPEGLEDFHLESKVSARVTGARNRTEITGRVWPDPGWPNWER